MTDMTQQNEQIDQQGQEELRDLDVPAGAAQEVKGGKVSVQDVSNTRGADKPFISANHNETLVRSHVVANHNETLVRNALVGNHNETLVRGGRLINHNETLVREGLKGQHNETLVRSAISVNHNETLVLHDLDLPEAEAEGVKGGALGDINGESQDNWHAAEIEVVSWKLSGAPDRPR